MMAKQRICILREMAMMPRGTLPATVHLSNDQTGFEWFNRVQNIVKGMSVMNFRPVPPIAVYVVNRDLRFQWFLN